MRKHTGLPSMNNPEKRKKTRTARLGFYNMLIGFLILRHYAEYFLIGLSHAVTAEPSDIADGVLDTL